MDTSIPTSTIETQPVIVLPTYFAVQMLPRESPHETVAAICRAGKEAGTLFRRLEVVDTMPFGTNNFLRCRSDILNPYPMLEKLLGQKRGHIVPSTGGSFSVRLANGRTGVVPGSVMYVTARSGFKGMYKGPKIKGWERAFESTR